MSDTLGRELAPLSRFGDKLLPLGALVLWAAPLLVACGAGCLRASMAAQPGGQGAKAANKRRSGALDTSARSTARYR